MDEREGRLPDVIKFGFYEYIVHSSYVIQNKSYWRIRISPIVDRLTKKRAHQQKTNSLLVWIKTGQTIGGEAQLPSAPGWNASVSPRINWQTPRSRPRSRLGRPRAHPWTSLLAAAAAAFTISVFESGSWPSCVNSTAAHYTAIRCPANEQLDMRCRLTISPISHVRLHDG